MSKFVCAVCQGLDVWGVGVMANLNTKEIENDPDAVDSLEVNEIGQRLDWCATCCERVVVLELREGCCDLADGEIQPAIGQPANGQPAETPESERA